MSDPALQPLLSELPSLAYGGVLLIARVGTTLMLLPLVGEAEVPMTVRAGFALLLVFLLLPVLQTVLPHAPDGPVVALAQIGAECITGLWFGWLTRLVIFALVVSAQIISLGAGQSSIVQPDPALGTQSAALSRLAAIVAPVILVASGLHALPIEALAGSYDVIPAGTLLPAADSAEEILRAVAAAFLLALQLAAPFLAASLLWHLGVALAGRLAPQLQPMILSAPGQLLGGLALLAMTLAGLVVAWRDRAVDILSALPGLR